MASFTLGSDVYLEFKAKVNGKKAIVSSVTGDLYHEINFMRPFSARNTGNVVSGLIGGETFTKTGEYIAKFRVGINGMGIVEHAITFKIKKSVLGKTAMRHKEQI